MTFPSQSLHGARIFFAAERSATNVAFLQAARSALRELGVVVVTVEKNWPKANLIRAMRGCRAVVAVDGPIETSHIDLSAWIAPHEWDAAESLGIPIYLLATPGSALLQIGNRYDLSAVWSPKYSFFAISSPQELHDTVRSVCAALSLDRETSEIIIVPQVGPELVRQLLQRPEELQRIPSRLFEALVAELLRADGWAVDLVIRPNAPGPDVIACSTQMLGRIPIQMIVECKRYSIDSPVGVEAVRNLVYWVNEEHRATLGMLATTGRFTAAAEEVVERQHYWRISLRDHDDILNWLKALGTTTARYGLSNERLQPTAPGSMRRRRG